MRIIPSWPCSCALLHSRIIVRSKPWAWPPTAGLSWIAWALCVLNSWAPACRECLNSHECLAAPAWVLYLPDMSTWTCMITCTHETCLSWGPDLEPQSLRSFTWGPDLSCVLDAWSFNIISVNMSLGHFSLLESVASLPPQTEGLWHIYSVWLMAWATSRFAPLHEHYYLHEYLSWYLMLCSFV